MIDTVFAQEVKQQTCVQTRTQTDGEGQSDVFERRNEGEVHQLRANQRENGDLNGSFDILARVETGCQHFNHNHPDQAEGVGNERLFSHLCGVQRKLTIHEQSCNQRESQHGKTDRGRQRQQHAQAQTPVEQVGKLFGILTGSVFGQGRQQDRAECHTQNTGRQFHQSVGKIYPRHTAGLQKRGEDSIDE